MDAKPLFLALLFAIFCTPARAQNDACPPYIEPKITVTSIFGEPKYDHTVSAKKLDAMITKTQQRNLRGTSRTVISSWTEGAIQLSVEYLEPRILASSTGVVCAQVATMNLKVNVVRPVTYIASEIPENSCSYQAVVQYELTGDAVARKFSSDILPVAKKYSQTFSSQLGLVRTRSVQEAEARVVQATKSYTDQLGQSFGTVLSDLETKNAIEEKKRLAGVCNGELMDIMRHAAQ